MVRFRKRTCADSSRVVGRIRSFIARWRRNGEARFRITGSTSRPAAWERRFIQSSTSTPSGGEEKWTATSKSLSARASPRAKEPNTTANCKVGFASRTVFRRSQSTVGDFALFPFAGSAVECGSSFPKYRLAIRRRIPARLQNSPAVPVSRTETPASFPTRTPRRPNKLPSAR